MITALCIVVDPDVGFTSHFLLLSGNAQQQLHYCVTCNVAVQSRDCAHYPLQCCQHEFHYPLPLVVLQFATRVELPNTPRNVAMLVRISSGVSLLQCGSAHLEFH